MVMIRFNGAKITFDDDTGEKIYSDRGEILLAREHIVGAYDHTILTTGDHKIRVMETLPEIIDKLVKSDI